MPGLSLSEEYAFTILLSELEGMEYFLFPSTPIDIPLIIYMEARNSAAYVRHDMELYPQHSCFSQARNEREPVKQLGHCY